MTLGKGDFIYQCLHFQILRANGGCVFGLRVSISLLDATEPLILDRPGAILTLKVPSVSFYPPVRLKTHCCLFRFLDADCVTILVAILSQDR